MVDLNDQKQSAQASTAPFPVPSLVYGRWLWFGLQQFTASQWDRICKQAAAWKLQGLSPKVGEGIYRWYDDAGLQMLKRTATRYGLRVLPYHYCYGPRFGEEQIAAEAQISIWAGNVFGAVSPDIESEYEGQYASAASFAQQVRASYKGLWLPTTFANPLDHPVPLLSLNPYIDAWLPQVYFSEWNKIAQSAIEFVYPQWLHFDQRARELGQGGLKPILPIISLENGLDQTQVAEFIRKMVGYKYIGFWSYETYAPYASTIKNSPDPGIDTPPPPIPNPPIPNPPPPGPLTFTSDDLQLWTLYQPIRLNEQAAIEQSWLRARRHRGLNFGPPLENEHDVIRNNRVYTEQQFSSARASWEHDNHLLTWWTANGPLRV